MRYPSHSRHTLGCCTWGNSLWKLPFFYYSRPNFNIGFFLCDRSDLWSSLSRGQVINLWLTALFEEPNLCLHHHSHVVGFLSKKSRVLPAPPLSPRTSPGSSNTLYLLDHNNSEPTPAFSLIIISSLSVAQRQHAEKSEVFGF